MSVGDLSARANRAVNGLLLRADMVSESLAADLSDADRRDMRAVVGGIHAMADAIQDVARHIESAAQDELVFMLKQAEISMDRIDAAFA